MRFDQARYLIFHLVSIPSLNFSATLFELYLHFATFIDKSTTEAFLYAHEIVRTVRTKRKVHTFGRLGLIENIKILRITSILVRYLVMPSESMLSIKIGIGQKFINKMEFNIGEIMS